MMAKERSARHKVKQDINDGDDRYFVFFLKLVWFNFGPFGTALGALKNAQLDE